MRISGRNCRQCVVQRGGTFAVPARRVAEHAHELDVLARVDERDLVDGRGAGRQQLAVLDEAGRSDEVDRELDPDRLQGMVVGEMVPHQRVAVDERDGSGHVNLR